MSIASCSIWSQKSKPLKITSSQENAEIYSSDNKLLGKTPFTMEESEILKVASNGVFQITVRKDGYQDQSLAIFVGEINEIKIDLKVLSDDHFNQWVLGSYSRQANVMIRDLLNYQGLIFLGDYDTAKTNLENFLKVRPGLGAPYTMLASIALKSNDPVLAKSLLLKALYLDPNDLTADKMLENLNAGEAK